MVGSLRLPGVTEGATDRRQGVLHDGGGIEVKGALLVALPLIGSVINPYRWNAEVLDRQQAVGANQAAKVMGEAEQPRIGLTQRVEVACVEIVAPAIEVETDAMVEDRPPAGEIKLALDQPGQAVIGRPAIQEETLFGQALTPSAEIARRQARFPKGQVHSVQLMPAVPAVLLPLTSHAVHERFLSTVIEGVEGRIKQTLQRRLAGLHVGLVWPRKDPAAHVHVAYVHGPLRVVNVQLQPAQALVVEGLEAVLALPADEARPRIEMGVEQGRPAGPMCLVDEQFDGRSGRRFEVEPGPADNLVLELKGEHGSARAIQLGSPLAGASLNRNLLTRSGESIRNAEVEVVLRRGMPCKPEGLRQSGRRHQRLPQHRNAAWAKLGVRRAAAQIERVFVIVGGEGGLIRRPGQGHRG